MGLSVVFEDGPTFPAEPRFADFFGLKAKHSPQEELVVVQGPSGRHLREGQKDGCNLQPCSHRMLLNWSFALTAQVLGFEAHLARSGGIARTSTVEFLRTCSVTLPISNLATPLRPCVESTIKSAFSSAADFSIS